jgi:hypothetical protein
MFIEKEFYRKITFIGMQTNVFGIAQKLGVK